MAKGRARKPVNVAPPPEPDDQNDDQDDDGQDDGDAVAEAAGAEVIDDQLEKLGGSGLASVRIHRVRPDGKETYCGEWQADTWDLQRFSEFYGAGEFRARFHLQGRRGIVRQRDFAVDQAFGEGQHGDQEDADDFPAAGGSGKVGVMDLFLQQMQHNNRLALELARSRGGGGGVREAVSVLNLAKQVAGDLNGGGGGVIEAVVNAAAAAFGPIIAKAMSPAAAAAPAQPRLAGPRETASIASRPAAPADPQHEAMMLLRRCLAPAIANPARHPMLTAAAIVEAFSEDGTRQMLSAIPAGQLAGQVIQFAPDLAGHVDTLAKIEGALRDVLNQPAHVDGQAAA